MEFDGMMCIYGRNWGWVCIIGGVYGGFDVGISGERKAMLCLFTSPASIFMTDIALPFNTLE